MTFIIAIQSEDSVILASDTRNFRIDDHYQLQAEFDQIVQKSYIWDYGIFASNGVEQIGQQVYKKLIESNNTNHLQSWLQQFSYQLSQQFSNYQLIDEQITCTQIYCSSLINNIPKLQIISQSLVEYFRVNEIRVMTYQKDFTLLAPLLRNLQQAIIARRQFVDNISWVQHYLSYLQPIFYQTNKAEPWVSQDFHVYFDYRVERFFGYIPNKKNSKIDFSELDL